MRSTEVKNAPGLTEPLRWQCVLRIVARFVAQSESALERSQLSTSAATPMPRGSHHPELKDVLFGGHSGEVVYGIEQ